MEGPFRGSRGASGGEGDPPFFGRFELGDVVDPGLVGPVPNVVEEADVAFLLLVGVVTLDLPAEGILAGQVDAGVFDRG